MSCQVRERAHTVVAARLRLVAAGVIVLGLLSTVANIAITALSERVDQLQTGWPWQAVTIACVLAGALITLSRPAHPVGWLFLGLGVLTPLGGAVIGGRLHIAGPEPSWWFTAAEAVATAETAGISLILLLFPTGRLVTPRWRAGVAVVVAAVALGTGSAVMNGGWGGDYPGEGGVAASPLLGRLDPLGSVLLAAFYPMLLAGFVISGVSLIVRYRRSRGEERQQLRWLAAAAGFLVLVAPLNMFIDSRLTTGLLVVSLCLIPLAASIAVLKYRLYDIDVVINRALVYGTLTVTLAAAYLCIVLLMQLSLRPLTERSDLAVAGSTLAVAALFRPARARIQELVDRRFYRSRYDAVRTLDEFNGRLREQLDLQALSADLCSVVRETVAPAHVSLWLREVRR